MSNYPSIKIHTCSENVVNAEYVDINYTSSYLFNIPTITVTIDDSINTFITNVTLTSARINFSAPFTGKVNYSVISIK